MQESLKIFVKTNRVMASFAEKLVSLTVTVLNHLKHQDKNLSFKKMQLSTAWPSQ